MLTNLNSLYPRIVFANLGWNSAGCSGEEDFKILSIYFRYFLNIPNVKVHDPTCEQTLIPFTQRGFVPSLVEIDLVILEKKMKIK